MLKWLRKYNTFILVIGGCLLMVAFLLQGVLNDLTKRGLLGGTAFKVNGSKVTQTEFDVANREYYALSSILEATGLSRGRDIIGMVGGGESPEHYYLLTREAQEAGLVGGVREGDQYFDEIAEAAANSMARFTGDADNARKLVQAGMERTRERVESDARLTPDQISKAFAKLRAAKRLQDEYAGALRYGERRLALESRDSQESVQADMVLVPAEREMAGIPEPDQAAIQAHFDKYKDTPKGNGDFGIGYKLPARVKIAWLELDRSAISAAVNVDPIEIEQRFRQKYPTGEAPAGISGADERKKIEDERRKELTDKAMRDAERIVRSEFDKSLRKLERDGEYYRVPTDWAANRPDLAKVAQAVVARMLEQSKIQIPAPKVVVRDATWVEINNVFALEGLGSASAKHGAQTIGLSQLLGGLKGIAETPEYGIQTQIPFGETLEDPSGNRYFFMVLDSRNESAPDSLEEIRPEIVRNIKRLEAYDKLKAREADLRSTAIASGLSALTTPPAGMTDATPVTIQKMQANKTRATPAALDTQSFRDKVLADVSGLDPLTDIKTLPADKVTFSAPVDKALSVCVYKVTKLLPLTIESFRSMQNYLIRQAATKDLGDEDGNPFTLDAMEKRLNVKYEEGHERNRQERKAAKAKK